MSAWIPLSHEQWIAGGIALSIVPSTYQQGMVSQAGVPEGAVSAP
jgi:hypothetical protein